jgi:small nuclear ribonucleoprotein D3
MLSARLWQTSQARLSSPSRVLPVRLRAATPATPRARRFRGRRRRRATAADAARPPRGAGRRADAPLAPSMSVTGKRGVGVPLILMHDGEGTIVTIECKNGDTYRGFLDETEDNMNCVLKDATRTDAKGNKSQVEHIFLRGSQIAFFIFPNMLKKAPMFNRVRAWRKTKATKKAGAPSGTVRGQAAAIIRKAQARLAGPGMMIVR